MRICIIGLGWLGEPLAKFLNKKGHEVKGSITSAQKAERLSKDGLNAFRLLFNPTPEGAGSEILSDIDLLIINIPPQSKTQKGDFHLQQISVIRTWAQEAYVPKIIFISATSVYPDLNQLAVEEDNLNTENSISPVLLEAENLLWREKNYDLTVLRLGGLLGDDRIPGIYFSKRKEVIGHAPVNYIYRHDAIRLIDWVILKHLWNDTYNGVAPYHPLRRTVYENNAAAMGFASPLSYEFPEVTPWKIVSSQKILQTGFVFDHHPLHFPYTFKKIF